ncbi:MAG TPA: haloacid dehalogenase type II [Anaeromyxobacter sp.]|nr:haloacid dehalogenase type II [Anaeromyxobacter sp.]
MLRPNEIRAVVFDAYGTLFDWASAAERERSALGPRWRDFAELWRSKQVQYTFLRSLQGRHADFSIVTTDALDHALEAFGVDDRALRARLLALHERLEAYPDARETLERLRQRGRATAILSNGTPGMLAAAVQHAGLSALFDAVLSVESVGIYKPHPSVYALASERLGLVPGQVLFVSANGWDAFSAKAFGFRVAWCNRTRQPHERIPERPDVEVRSLEEVGNLLA